MNIDLIDLNKIYNDSINMLKFKNNIYKSFLSIKNEFSFIDEVNSYLDKYYFKIIRTIIYFIDNGNIECLIGKNNVVIV